MTPTLQTGSGRGLLSAGFTLIEMLVAVTIGGMIMTAVYGAFSAANRTTRRLDSHDAMLQNMRSFSSSFRDDVRAACHVADHTVAHTEWKEGTCRFRIAVDDLQYARIQYRLTGDRVLRIYKPLDSKKRTESKATQEHSRTVATGVDSITLAYFVDGRWRNNVRRKQWPEAIRLEVRFKSETRERPTLRHVVRVEAE